MSAYKDSMKKLHTDEQFKSDLLEKMCAKAENGGVAQGSLIDFSQNNDVERRNVDTGEGGDGSDYIRERVCRRCKIKRIVASVACAVVACLVIVPLAVNFANGMFAFNGGSAPNQGTDSDEPSAPNDSGDSSEESFGFGEKVEDDFGNYLVINDVSGGDVITIGEREFAAGQDNVFVILSAQADFTHQTDGGFIGLTSENISATAYGSEDFMTFRSDIFEAQFSGGEVQGEFYIVFEAARSFVDDDGVPSAGVGDNDVLCVSVSAFEIDGEPAKFELPLGGVR